MKRALDTYLRALPTYAGSKKSLLGWISKHLNEVLPLEFCQSYTFLDAFSGGGSVSLMAKALNFKQILANDWSTRSNIIGKGLLCNEKITLSHQDLLFAAQDLPELGFIQTHYCSSVFSTRHAQALDKLLYASSQVQCKTKQALYKLLLWHVLVECVAFPTSIGTSNRPFAGCQDSLREWDSLNPKRYQDGSIQKLLQPTWPLISGKAQLINQGVFKGTPITMTQQDAFEFVSQHSGDVLYADPPYMGTLSYEKTNKVLDSVLRGQLIEGPPVSSPFTQSTQILDALLESSRHIPIWALSYGNHQFSLEDLVKLVQAHAPEREVKGFSKRYQHMPHVSKATNNLELLVIAAPKKGFISHA